MKYSIFKIATLQILIAVVCLFSSMHTAQAQCGSNPDFVVGPDGTNTPTIVRVIDTVVSGPNSENGVGNVIFGTSDGSIAQTQTLRIVSTGLLAPDNSDACAGGVNTAGVFLNKTGILEMQGGELSAITLSVTGPATGEVATGGKLVGYGQVSASGDGFSDPIQLDSATLAPSGGILFASAGGGKIALRNSTFVTVLNPSYYLDVDGLLSLTNTKLVVNAPANFSAAPGQEFTLVKFSSGFADDIFSRSDGTPLNEGDTVTVNGIDLKITYAGGTSGQDIVLFREASANSAPTISAIANQTTNEDSPKGPISFTVNDVETPNTLTVTAASSNTTLLPLSNIVLGGSGANRTVTLSPSSNQSGSAVVTLTVSDGDLTNSSQFTLTVIAVNDPPTISAIANQTTNEDTAKGPISFTVNDVETPNSLTVTAASSNTTLLPVSRITLSGSGANRTVTLTPATDKNGTATVTLTVSDGNLSNNRQFTLTVNAVNDPPVAQNQSTTTNINTAKAITLQATDIENNALTFSVVASPTHGNLTGTGPNLTYTPTTNYSGPDSFTFRANDGTANSNTATVNITVKSAPAITSFTPTSGTADTVVTITGVNFTGATQVQFNGTNATFAVNSNTQISATAPSGVTTGKISVTTPDGTATSTANFTVNANPGNPSVSINDATLTEGDTGTKNATLTITLSKVSNQTISINAIPFNGSARSPGDYTSGGVRLVFDPGQVSKTFSVPIKGDLLNETNETIFVILSSPVNVNISRGRGVITIVDNDPIPSITIDNVSIGEGNVGQRVAAFRLKLSAPSGQLVKVTASTADGTTTAGDDYVTLAPTQIAFTTGNSFAYARVFINGDVLNEQNETFFVNLSSPIAATIADAQALGTILNDDRAPALTVNDVSVTEGNSGTKILTFKVALSEASGQTVTVKYATADGIARSTSDFAAKNGTLTFAPGTALTRNISVIVNGDTTIEGNETFFLLLSAATNATIGKARGTGTILNDDSS